MSASYLEVTFRRGKPLAGYLYLQRQQGDVSARTERAEAGLLVDYAADGRPIGIEISAPSQFTLEALNRVLSSLRQAPAAPVDLAPLVGAAVDH